MKEFIAKIIVALFFVLIGIMGTFLCILLLPAAAIMWAMDQIQVDRYPSF